MSSEYETKTVAQWGCFDHGFTTGISYANPLQDVRFTVSFFSPTGKQSTVDGFWDGSTTWRVRFSPSELGTWNFSTYCSDNLNIGLQGQTGAFDCVVSDGHTVFDRHGRIRVASNGRYLEHTDGTPFFWLADTAWNGPLRSTQEDWNEYLHQRVHQAFTAVQVATTQWVAAPDGDLEGRLAYTGLEQIQVIPEFFQRLDEKLAAINRAGLLAVPVLLWTAGWSTPEANMASPGFALPEDQSILLARYMIARWGAFHLVWILNGDGDYQNERAARWKRIGRAAFVGDEKAPVSLHPQSLRWDLDEFSDEAWLDIVGYQSGHNGDEEALRWLLEGPPSTGWRSGRARTVINLEPPYEYAISFKSRVRLEETYVRRMLYFSTLISPVAGVTYGAHGVWGWDEGSSPPVNHPVTGIPLPYKEGLHMRVAEQITHLATAFRSIDWWNLSPSPEILAYQPGKLDLDRTVCAAQSALGTTVIYVPLDQKTRLKSTHVPSLASARWFDPRIGTWYDAYSQTDGDERVYMTPGAGDWVLIITPEAPGEIK